MLVYVIRTLILYIAVITAIRIMGKRQIGEMQPSELVVAIMISDLASVPMQAIDLPLLNGIIPVFTLIIAEVLISYASLKSRTVRKIITGEPSIIIYNGHINQYELNKLRFNINDLLEQLRINNYPNIADVQIAMLETNGQISIVPKKDARYITVKDMNLKNANVEMLPCTIISDGYLIESELKRSGNNISWLKNELKKRNIKSFKDVFIASYDINSGLLIQKRGEEDLKNEKCN